MLGDLHPLTGVFRRDLCIADNAALSAALADGPTLALYVLDDAADGRPLGRAGRWWLHHAIVRLQRQLADLGVPLILRKGSQNPAVIDVAIATGARRVCWNRRYTPWGARADKALRIELGRIGIRSDSFEGAYLHKRGRC